MLSADAEHNFVKAVLKPLAGCAPAELGSIAAALGDKGYSVLASEGYQPEDATIVLAADLRYVGQSSELTVPLVSARFSAEAIAQLVRDFQAMYHQTFGYSSDEPLELVNLRVSARGRSKHRLDFATCQVDGTALRGEAGTRLVSFAANEAPVATRIVPRAQLTQAPEQGPLVIESYDTTIVVPPHCSARADAVGNIIIDLQEQAA
ncbi:hypothetical protein D3C71_1396790 [compost metagenome]